MGCGLFKKKTPTTIAMNDQKPTPRKTMTPEKPTTAKKPTLEKKPTVAKRPTTAEKLAMDRKATNARYYMDVDGKAWSHVSDAGCSICLLYTSPSPRD